MLKIKRLFLYLLLFTTLLIINISCAGNKLLLQENESLSSEKMQLEDKIKKIVAECEEEKKNLKATNNSLVKKVDNLQNKNKQLIKEKENTIKEIIVTEEKKRLIISLPNKILFKVGDIKIKDNMEPVLKIIAEHIRKYPDRMILINGHTCNLPIKNSNFPSNWELSARRATEVVRYFIEKEKLPPAQFSAVGLGEYHPKSDNNTEAERMKNRRVEIIIFSKELTDQLMK